MTRERDPIELSNMLEKVILSTTIKVKKRISLDSTPRNNNDMGPDFNSDSEEPPVIEIHQAEIIKDMMAGHETTDLGRLVTEYTEIR